MLVSSKLTGKDEKEERNILPTAVVLWLRYLAADLQVAGSNPGCGDCITDGVRPAASPAAAIDDHPLVPLSTTDREDFDVAAALSKRSRDDDASYSLRKEAHTDTAVTPSSDHLSFSLNNRRRNPRRKKWLRRTPEAPRSGCVQSLFLCTVRFLFFSWTITLTSISSRCANKTPGEDFEGSAPYSGSPYQCQLLTRHRWSHNGLLRGTFSSFLVLEASSEGRTTRFRFARSVPPEHVSLYGPQLRVHHARSLPLQCRPCDCFAHVAEARYCTGNYNGCSHHYQSADTCRPRCINWGGRHAADNCICPRWQEEVRPAASAYYAASITPIVCQLPEGEQPAITPAARAKDARDVLIASLLAILQSFATREKSAGSHLRP
ncbi:hypothetical protein HPB51_018080 [Rhipicephalus microplus]|uniref:Uncharacterized protein n=1 Tax=Rhipicephalus microplus TaxID=6941 RepID=A0A9J6E3K0_RHIMP|nr:hypothetical protein HPB51_018080 [Rhipicephalus microplus]